MTAPAGIEATTKTREVVRTEPPLEIKRSRWSNWQEKTRGSSVPSTPTSATVQSLFNNPLAAAVVRDPSNVFTNTFFYTKEFLRKYFLIWYWAAYMLLTFVGFDFFLSLFVATVCLGIGCITFGLVRSVDEAVKAKRAKLNAKWQQPTLGLPPSIAQQQKGVPFSWDPPVNVPTAVVNSGPSDAFVGNLILGIYHLGTCDWVNRISTKNRVGFSTASEALSHGFKPCRICSPA